MKAAGAISSASSTLFAFAPPPPLKDSAAGVAWCAEQRSELKEAGAPALLVYAMGNADSAGEIVRKVL
jgi:hypothetical protein